MTLEREQIGQIGEELREKLNRTLMFWGLFLACGYSEALTYLQERL